MCTQRRSDVPHVPMSDEPATTRDHRLSERTYDAGERCGGGDFDGVGDDRTRTPDVRVNVLE